MLTFQKWSHSLKFTTASTTCPQLNESFEIYCKCHIQLIAFYLHFCFRRFSFEIKGVHCFFLLNIKCLFFVWGDNCEITVKILNWLQWELIIVRISTILENVLNAVQWNMLNEFTKIICILWNSLYSQKIQYKYGSRISVNFAEFLKTTTP